MWKVVVEDLCELIFKAVQKEQYIFCKIPVTMCSKGEKNHC